MKFAICKMKAQFLKLENVKGLTLDFAKSQWQICRINHNDENQKTIEEFDFSNTNDVVILEKL